MPEAVGIDLGTTTSEVAFWNRELRQPGIDLVRFGDVQRGDWVVPSVVTARGNKVLVGDEADRAEGTKRTPSLRAVKLHLGKDRQQLRREMPKLFIPGPEGEEIGPVEASAHIFRYLVEGTEKYIAYRRRRPIGVNEAIVTVPAVFKDAAKKDTLEAAKLAGLTVQRLIPEPSAAFVGYLHQQGWLQSHQPRTVLVYDLGGGTFDATICRYLPAKNRIEVLAKVGDDTLGGTRFDEVIFDRVYRELLMAATHLSFEEGSLKGDSRLVWEDAMVSAEKLKKDLSSSESGEVSADFSLGKYGEKEWPQFIPVRLKRSDFEDWIGADIRATREQLETKLFPRAGLRRDDVDCVLLAGGSTKIPLVRRTLAERFSEAKIIEADKLLGIVAMGAGLLAHPDSPLHGKFEFVDVLSRSVACRVPGTRDKFQVLITKGTPLNEAQALLRLRWPQEGKAAELEMFEEEAGMQTGFRPIGDLVVEPDAPLPPGSQVTVTLRCGDSGIDDEHLIARYGDRPLRVRLRKIGAAQAKDATSFQYENARSVDIVFALDTTGSMRFRKLDFDQLIRAEIHKLIDDVAREADFRFGFVGFGDHGEEEEFALSPNRERCHDQLRVLPQCEGGDTEECCLEAVASALRMLHSSRPDSERIIALFTDAPPKRSADQKMRELTDQLSARGIKSIVVAPKRLEVEAFRVFDELRGDTGRYFDVFDELNEAFAALRQQLNGAS